MGEDKKLQDLAKNISEVGANKDDFIESAKVNGSKSSSTISRSFTFDKSNIAYINKCVASIALETGQKISQNVAINALIRAGAKAMLKEGKK